MKITLLNGPTCDYQNYCGFPLKIVNSLRAKRLSLRIDEKQHIPVLTIPKRCSQRKVKEFLDTNHDWAVNMMARLPAAAKFCDGEKISFWGKDYVIKHCPEEKATGFAGDVLKVSGGKEFLHRRVMEYLKAQCLKIISEMTVEKAALLGKKVKSVTIKDTRSRWGSCTTSGHISYNWRICMAPVEVIEYLVCHEVSHLKHPDHSAEFWNCVAMLHSAYKETRRWLKTHGKSLYKYI
ncbi:MAG: M48 family metallopeptidase [Alphaproteobacteria bacterium]|nr:M48 family metallopeptidase [Alphaproteobacteria bacterium]